MLALPIDPLLAEITRTASDRGLVVLEAPPGAGKTTRVPMALHAALGVASRVLVTEPRRLAARLAKRLGDELVLVHALEPYAAFPLEFQAASAQLEATRRKIATEELHKVAASLASGVTVHEKLVDGFAEQVLATEAAEGQVRLVVVGSHGRRAPARWCASRPRTSLGRRCRDRRARR